MALIPQFLTLLLAVVACLGDDNLCPSPEDLSPCTCVKGHPNVKVVCRMVDNLSQVRRALQSLKDIRGVTVTFFNCSLGLVPSDLFKGLQVTELVFDYCTLQGIGNEGREALEGLEDTIESFRVSSTNGRELRFPNVSGLHKLSSLSVGWNGISELGDEWFPANLKILSLQGNGIERLGDRAFARLANLRELWLGSNKIASLKRSMFPSSGGNLKLLDIRNNDISTLPVDLFSNMSSLTDVYLKGNSLRHIPEATWAQVWNGLDTLELQGNPLECDSHIEWTFARRLPVDLRGTCTSPPERSGRELRKVIEDKQRE